MSPSIYICKYCNKVFAKVKDKKRHERMCTQKPKGT